MVKMKCFNNHIYCFQSIAGRLARVAHQLAQSKFKEVKLQKSINWITRALFSAYYNLVPRHKTLLKEKKKRFYVSS